MVRRDRLVSMMVWRSMVIGGGFFAAKPRDARSRASRSTVALTNQFSVEEDARALSCKSFPCKKKDWVPGKKRNLFRAPVYRKTAVDVGSRMAGVE